MHVLNESWKTPSIKERFIRSLIGSTSTSIQDVRSVVGIESRIQLLFDEAIMIPLISSEIAGEKTDSRGGFSFGREKGLRDGVGSFEQSIAILLLNLVQTSQIFSISLFVNESFSFLFEQTLVQPFLKKNISIPWWSQQLLPNFKPQLHL